MDLICYLQPGWVPLIRPAPSTRAWMDDTTDSFAYRCLPLNIANAHGWEVLSPVGFLACWDGTNGPDAITIAPDPDADPAQLPVSLFGFGVLTFHIQGVFRTPAGWNIWIGGSPNRAKDGIHPLGGIVETDWSPFSFTMNWRFTRPHHWVRFEALEPFCFIFPVQRAAITAFRPAFKPMEADPALKLRFENWSKARDAFHVQVAETPPDLPADSWQKHYYTGVDIEGVPHIKDHVTKLRLQPFDRRATPSVPIAPANDERRGTANVKAPPPLPVKKQPGRPPLAEAARLKRDLQRWEWLLEAIERQRILSAKASRIERRSNLSQQVFLDEYYAPSRPVILTGELTNWPAVTRWTPDYLRDLVGGSFVEFQCDRTSDSGFETQKENHRTTAPFDMFIQRITRPGAGNESYLTAYNSAANRAALAPLHAELGRLEKFLTPNQDNSDGMFWIGPEGTLTPLHHDLTNNFLVQITGRKRVKLLPASEVGRLYNTVGVFSDVHDLEQPDLDAVRFGRLEGARIFDLVLEAGEILFIPLAWWHQIKALSFSVTVSYTNFIWPNDAYQGFPGDA